jgi:AraC family transcriptional regulator of adaptative response/methylated-DNA-[protein]-cysteine methyltransferase
VNSKTKLIENICQFLQQTMDEPITLAALGKRFGIDPFHLQRMFKSAVGVSPREYADSLRMKTFKSQLRSGRSVTDAIYEAGFGSSSRLYERSESHLGMTPATYKRGGEGALIRYTVADSPLGRILLAGTTNGVCAIQFGGSDSQLVENLQCEFPKAELQRGDTALRSWVRTVLDQFHSERPLPQLPLDVRATAFQRRVWEHLQSIPYGKTESYGNVAHAIGRPSATRAVARACATNPIAVAIPCHRVVRGTGGLGGYRWGIERKKALLRIEQRAGKRSL